MPDDRHAGSQIRESASVDCDRRGFTATYHAWNAGRAQRRLNRAKIRANACSTAGWNAGRARSRAIEAESSARLPLGTPYVPDLPDCLSKRPRL